MAAGRSIGFAGRAYCSIYCDADSAKQAAQGAGR